jgi:two-component system OmpR family sensor kinase
MRLIGSVAARVTWFTLVLGILLAGAAIFGIDLTARMYHQEANQRLHRDLAQWLINQYHFERDGHIDTNGIPMVFGDAMSINPSIEVYLVDTAGKILAFNAPRGQVKLDRIAIEPILRFLNSEPQLPILGTDPRNPGSQQVFSAAPILAEKRIIGYAYVVVGGELYQGLVSRLRFSRILQAAAIGVAIVVLAGAISGFAGFWFFVRRIMRLSTDMEAFSRSGFMRLPAAPKVRLAARFDDELDRLGARFRELAEVVHGQVLKLQTADTQLREAITLLSHDLRTPLTALGGYLDTISMRGENLTPHERQEYVEFAIAQHRRLSRLVRAQFDLAMLESVAFPFAPEHASLSDLINDVGQKFIAVAKAVGVELTVDSPPAGIYASVDVGLLERVLENLISNAIRHTQPGGKVGIQIREEPEHIVICVADTGCGISAADVPNIFDRYFRSTDAARSRSEGAGLGLAIARRVIELHGGEITVSSHPGSGSTFCVYLARLPSGS